MRISRSSKQCYCVRVVGGAVVVAGRHEESDVELQRTHGHTQ